MALRNDDTSKKRVVLKDIATAAGVSSATVSRVLSGGRAVSPELTERVLAIAESLDYHPDRVAHSLRKSNPLSVGIVVSDITNPFYAGLARSAQQVLFPAGHMTALYDTERSAGREREYVSLLEETRVGGLILNSCAPDAAYYEKFSIRYGIPVVLVDTLRSQVLDSVRVDNSAGTLHAIAHLASRGYRRIAMVAGSQAVLSGFERLEAYKRAVEMYGLERHDGYVQMGDWSEQCGYALALNILQLDPRPQAIFASNNTLGVGVFRALKAEGLQIPSEIALLVFDDFELAELCDPAITVVAQPVSEIGRVAAQLLMNRMHGEGRINAQEIMLQPQLSVRSSV